MTAPPRHDSSALDDARAALGRGAWEDAIARLEECVAAEPTPAEAWETLGVACTWLQRGERAIEARQRAYELYREHGDDAGAARVALDLASDYFDVRGEPAVANGWFQRARRLLAGLPPHREHALLLIWDAYMALLGEADAVAAEAFARDAVAVAEEVGAGDAGVLALALQGLSCVSQGRVDDGMKLLDEAVAGALGREVADPQWFYLTCCCMIDACDRVRDYARAMQWCDRLHEFCSRWRVQSFLTTCRIKYTQSLLWRGDWARCESELERALAELEATKPVELPAAYVRLAELRRRQGRRRDAEELLERAGPHPLALSVRAALAFDAGDAATSLELMDTWLRRTSDRALTERIAALELKARAHAALGQLDEAEAAVRELNAIIDVVATDALKATSLVAAGVLAAAASQHETAARSFDDAAYRFEACGSPYESARARIEQARALIAIGRAGAAAKVAAGALVVLEEIGAAPDVKRARALLDRLGAGAGAARRPGGRARSSAGTLTARQREVLALVAHGLSDREVAARLFISEHTVHRHIANILTRLNVSSRAAAVARALRGELL